MPKFIFLKINLKYDHGFFLLLFTLYDIFIQAHIRAQKLKILWKRWRKKGQTKLENVLWYPRIEPISHTSWIWDRSGSNELPSYHRTPMLYVYGNQIIQTKSMFDNMSPIILWMFTKIRTDFRLVNYTKWNCKMVFYLLERRD